MKKQTYRITCQDLEGKTHSIRVPFYVVDFYASQKCEARTWDDRLKMAKLRAKQILETSYQVKGLTSDRSDLVCTEILRDCSK